RGLAPSSPPTTLGPATREHRAALSPRSSLPIFLPPPLPALLRPEATPVPSLSSYGHEVQREQYGSQLTEQDSGFLNDSNLSQLSYADATQPSPETSGTCPPLTPMTPITPMTPVSESSGIVPQLQRAKHQNGKRRFAAVIMRIREPRTTALIFSSGKMVCTGAKSEEQSRLAARKYARVVQKLGFPAKFLDFKIQNMVGSCDVRFPIRLEGLVLTHQQFSSYEPELFPGLIYRMVKPRIVLLIFVSGKVVLTGAKERSEIYEAFENIYPILKGFKKAS
uniref:Uncharacterized protein n=1 Tax=Gopherus agassizii TaxID=38772 RepID=A0A452HNG9_9SAUR